MNKPEHQQDTPKRLIEGRKQRVVDLIARGTTDLAIARDLGEHLTQVQRWRKQAGYTSHNFEAAKVGALGEDLVYKKCCKLGYVVEKTPTNWPFDLVVNQHRVEVKTAATVTTKVDPRTNRSVETLAFNIGSKRGSLYGHTYGKNYLADCDFVIAVWLKDAPVFWVVPITSLPKQALWIQVSNYPNKSRKYAGFENAFSLLEVVI